jgi:hypothetical protein
MSRPSSDKTRVPRTPFLEIAPDSSTARIVLLHRLRTNLAKNEGLEQLKEEVRRLSGGQIYASGIDNLPDHTAEQFLRHVIAVETAPTTTDFDRLTADGVPLPPPEEPPDGAMGSVLWRTVLHALG